MGDNGSKKGLSRRKLLDHLIGAAIAVTGIGFGGGAVSFWYPPETTTRKKDKIEAGKKDSLPVGSAVKVDFNGEPVLVMHVAGGFFAVSAVCTHLGCIVEWSAEKQQVVCPCHNATFDYRGNIVSGPPPTPLKSFLVEVQGDTIMVGKEGA